MTHSPNPMQSSIRRIAESLRRLRMEAPEALYGRLLSLERELEQLQQATELPSEVLRYLDLSTAHVSQRTLGNFLSGEKRPWMSVAAYEYGAFVTVPASEQERVRQGGEALSLPADLEKVFEHARSLGCDAVRFDADGPVIEGLPTFDW